MRTLTAAASVPPGTAGPPAPRARPPGNRPSQDLAAFRRLGSGASMPSPAGGPNEGHRRGPHQDTGQVPGPRRAADTAAAPGQSMPAAGLAAPLPIGSPRPDLPCRDDPELFFAESPDDVELAKALCRECPARAACLAGALKRREPWGVWGGELFLRGAIVPRKRPRGRPRKTDLAA